MDDLVREFLTETSESLAVLDVELVKFEQDPNDAAMLGNIFRLVHTIKGTCGFLGLARLEAVAHAGENILGKFRDGELPVTPDAVTLILKCIDRVRYLLGELEIGGAEPPGDDAELIAELTAAAEGGVSRKPVLAAATENSAALGPIMDENGFPVAAELLAEIERALALAGDGGGDGDAAIAAPPPVAAPKPAAPFPSASAAPEPKAGEAKDTVSNASIRVNVDVLEDLMTLVSELVLTRNQLLQMVRGQDDSAFKVPLQRLSHITSDLQEGVMKTRMQPIGNAWAKLPRIVRDLSLEMGKKIELVMQGQETELDRQVLELVKDPLTHMVRNSADHGLESPADRRAAGKSETGHITLKAYHEGGQIVIVVADDGRGLNTEKIRAKALANKLATEAELEGMSDQQVLQFIFRPGFSTAEKVTNVSGRGVGMDVVRNNIERIGGAIELMSTQGAGTYFTIKIPLTLAIVSALIVCSDEERFAIPQLNVLELVRVSPKSETRIETVHASPVLRLRERLLPLVSLRKLLKLSGSDDMAQDELFIVVAQVGAHQFGVIVDQVFDTEEIVVKPVSPILRDVPFYSGNTILGDGSVIMILDPNGIAAAAGQTRVGSGEDHDNDQAEVDEARARMSFLLFRAGSDELKAVPLALVARLEQIDLSLAERVHGRYVVQYRDRLMPLVPFDPDHQWTTEGRQPVLVFTETERSIGLVVDQIVDIVEDHMSVELSSATPGLVGSAIIAGKATDIIDVSYYLTKGLTDWFGSAGATAAASAAGRKLLLVDDSAFFRNLLTPVLSVAGWQVTAAEGPHEALKLRDDGRVFDVIVSDIEMPRMDGIAFALDVRADARWKDTPMVALSTRVEKEIIAQALKSGFDTYVAKSDRDTLLNTLAGLIAGEPDAESTAHAAGDDQSHRAA
jgi:two-component system chemotaxis sensor kinase CheA